MFFQFIRPLMKRNFISILRITRNETRTLKSGPEAEVEVNNKPIKYTSSKAGKWKAKYTSAGELYFTTPKIQPPVIMLSLIAFLVYFCILREENDLDDEMRSMETVTPLKLEEATLRAQIEHCKRTRQSYGHLERKLQEVINKRMQVAPESFVGKDELVFIGKPK